MRVEIKWDEKLLTTNWVGVASSWIHNKINYESKSRSWISQTVIQPVDVISTEADPMCRIHFVHNNNYIKWSVSGRAQIKGVAIGIN